MSRPPVPGLGRREAHERAVQLVYEAEQRDLRAEPLIDEQFVVPDAYTAVLVRGTERHRARIDGLITKFATGWPLSRMPALDRAVLRIAVYELGHEPEVPTAVILNEAVEFANSYSTDDSGRFINGVLASVAVEVRPDDGPVSASSELLANTSVEVVELGEMTDPPVAPSAAEQGAVDGGA